MSMFIWRVEFDYQLDEQEHWLRDVAHHLGDDNGGMAVNYVREKMLGTEVEITVGQPLIPALSNKQSKRIVDWRLTGLAQICKLNFIDTEVLITSGVIAQETHHDHSANGVVESTDPIHPGPQGVDDDNSHRACQECIGFGCRPGDTECNRTPDKGKSTSERGSQPVQDIGDPA